MDLGSSRNDCHICQNHVIGGAWPWLCRHELQENAAQAAKRRSIDPNYLRAREYLGEAYLQDKDLYLAAGDLVLEARYADALPLLFRIKDRNNPRVLNLIGYSTRKLGDIDKGIDYYHQALAIDPNYTKARQYLGEAYLLKDDVGKAKEQLMEIAQRCGGPCDDYQLLVKAIVDHVAGEANVEW